jgi:GNAT superfamily N-acetyltransferase
MEADPMGKTTIRPATLDDLDVLMDIGEAMHKESPRFSRMSYSQAKVLQTFIDLINADCGLLVVAEQDGEIIGGIAAMVAPHWFSHDLMASDLALFILPEHRGGMTAVRLIKHYIGWAGEKGAVITQMGISTGVHAEATAAMFSAVGLKQFGYLFEV